MRIYPNNPSIDPANNGTLAGTLNFFLQKSMMRLEHVLPAQIVSYDRTTNRAAVQPLIYMITTNNDKILRAKIAQVPVLLLGGGGFSLSFNLPAGSLGWIVSNDRDISLFLQSYEQAIPNTNRMFSFSDSFFIPDVMHGVTIAEEDEASAVFQNAAGTVKVSLSTGKIKIKAPIIEIEGETEITGDLAVVGNITATGTITPGA